MSGHRIDHKLKVNSDDLIHQLHNYDVDLKSNHIYLMGVDRGYEVNPGTEEPGVEFIMASRFIKNINICMRVNQDKPIIIHMKTCGGDWQEGMAIYDAIKSCPSRVIILNYTHARSMSSIIFQAADKRIMMPNSYFMLHDGTYGIEGTVKQVKSAVKFEERTEKTMLEIYATSMAENGAMAGKDKIKIKKWLRNQMDSDEDVYLTAEQAVFFGLADAVFNYDWKTLSE
jgi:ATP-dependent protease ClpP protease subunit